VRFWVWRVGKDGRGCFGNGVERAEGALLSWVSGGAPIGLGWDGMDWVVLFLGIVQAYTGKVLLCDCRLLSCRILPVIYY
jgi:hypothetical protein